MFKIFLVLAGLAILLITGGAVLGLRIGDYNELYRSLMSLDAQRRSVEPGATPSDLRQREQALDQVYRQLEGPRRRASQHILVGIAASLVAVLVNSISVTYFIGTSRWCREVVETYGLDPELVAESIRLKRRSFPWALVGTLLVLAIVALGAAADPGTLRKTTQYWVLPHFILALGGGALIALSFLVQGNLIRCNSAVVDRILTAVREVRRERGLDVEG